MTTYQIDTRIEIDAPAARVWAVLTDFPRMETWNPFITAISGDISPGARLSVRIVPPGKAGMTFAPTVMAVRPGRELRWRGRLLVSGLFDGEHVFLLEPLGEERTRLTHAETFSGLLVGPLRKTLAATEAGFRAMNTALKQEAEGRPQPRA